ncbi:MAG: hypothetical protein H0V89_14065 [Deltaproteobacteria bacterium]|nr:hypothetical protein [Deltaproteobacteria bacterium]
MFPDFVDWAADRIPLVDPPAMAASYRFADTAWVELAAAVRARPGTVEAYAIGESHRGEPIWAFDVSDPGTVPEREVLVFAGIHALEWISTEVALDVLHEWIALPPPGVRLTVVPILNPDGRRRVEGDLVVGANTYRRGNQGNVDLNRDFDVNREAVAVWKAVIPARYGTSAAALSQPESRALDSLANERRFDRAASLHAFGGYLYHPWSGRWARPPDYLDLHRLGREMETAQAGHAYRTRQLSRWGFFFRAHGTEIDHLYGKYGTSAWLIELTRSGLQPGKRDGMRAFFRWYNPERSTAHRQRGVAGVRALALAP